MDEDINVFICEDRDAWKEIIEKYMLPKKVTFAALFPKEARGKIVEALDAIQDEVL